MSTMAVDQPWLWLPTLQDLAVADVPDHAAAVAQPGDPQADRLDGADGAHAGVDQVADAVLVLEDEEDPGQEVLDQATAPRSRPPRPTMPALASSGPIGSPRTSRIITNATATMTVVVMLRSTDDIVSARCLRRSDSSEVSKILAVFPRASTPGTVPSAARSATRRINRFTMNRTTSAMTTIEAICGRPGEQPVRRLGEAPVAGALVDPVAEGSAVLVVDAAGQPQEAGGRGGRHGGQGREQHGTGLRGRQERTASRLPTAERAAVAPATVRTGRGRCGAPRS